MLWKKGNGEILYATHKGYVLTIWPLLVGWGGHVRRRKTNAVSQKVYQPTRDELETRLINLVEHLTAPARHAGNL